MLLQRRATNEQKDHKDLYSKAWRIMVVIYRLVVASHYVVLFGNVRLQKEVLITCGGFYYAKV
jgi:hypothetical protein